MLNAARSSGRRRRLLLPALLIAALVLIFVILTGLLDGGIGVLPKRLLDQPRYPVANALPGLLFAGVLLALSRRLLLSFGLAFLLQGLFYAVNTLKVANLGTPLLPADFQMLGQLRKGGLHLLAGYLPHSPWPYLLLLVGVALLIAIWHYEPPLFARRTNGKRWLGGGLSGLLLITLIVGLSPWEKLYNSRVLWLEPWSATSTTLHSGLVSSLVMFHLHYGHGKHKPSVEAATALINSHSAELNQTLQTPANRALPDIVVIQSESLFDPTIMRGYESSHFTPNLKRLAAQGISGPLHVPTFGGGTIRTEFEVLTGLSLRYFDNLQFPYLQLGRKPVPGLVRTLNAHGYETVAVHGNDPAFWNRSTAFKALGFDHFVSRSSFPANAAKDGKYMTDSAMTDEIMKQMKDSGPPQFIFAISIEAHGPYDVEPQNTAERDAIPVPAGITGTDKQQLQTYLYHIEHADAQLGRLVQWLAQRKRPSLVLFYGDHLPALVGGYNTAGFTNGQGMLSQAGIWLMVDPQHPMNAPTQPTAAWLLPGRLLALAGIHDSAFFTLTQLAGEPLAPLTEAPNAIPVAESADLQKVDSGMSSIEQLRLSGKLSKLLPNDALTPQKK